jgi:hypothetical protein
MLDLVACESTQRGITRRQMLRAGFLGLGSLSLADLLRLRAAGSPGQPKKDTAIIVLWVHGGPSHLETYDLKPDAPTATRSIFKPIRTRVPGLDVCEYLPRHAQIADKFTLLRSVAHDEADHGFGTRRFCTGFAKELPGSNNGPAYYPAMECVINRSLGVMHDGVPVSMNVGSFQASTPWRGAGYWGQKFEVPQTQVHPESRTAQGLGLSGLTVKLPKARLDDRRRLLGQFDQMRKELDKRGTIDAMDEFQKQAYAIMTGSKARDALDLTREPDRVRQRYDAMGFGQDLLLARRLVEAGVSFVNVYINGQPHGAKGAWFNWDDHAVNWSMGTAMKHRLPWYDHIVTTLIEDIYERGLDQRVMIIVNGEFGRTPRLEHNSNGNIGRDHWPNAMSILVAGGGRKRGDVIGATNTRGEHPITRRYDPHDFLATVYHYLGIDPAREYPDLTGRPLPLTRGEVIKELL